MLTQNFDVDAQIDTLGRLPEQVNKGIRAASRQAAAAGYRRGLREIPLSEGILRGYRRWFTDGRENPGTTTAWLGESPLAMAGEWEDVTTSRGRTRRRRADIDFPAEEAERVVNDVVLPEMLKIYEGVAEREIQKAVARG